MYHGTLAHRYIHEINPMYSQERYARFYIVNSLIPPLFSFNTTKYNQCYVINSEGIYILPKYSNLKQEMLNEMYNVFRKPKYKHELNIQSYVSLLTKNKINIRFVKFKELKYNTKNIEMYTNLYKETLVIFETLCEYL